jgi:hypothetical protein
MYLPSNQIIEIVSNAINGRAVLTVLYQHTTDGEVVNHTVAPFDIGSSNPKTAHRFANNLYAFSYTRINDKTHFPDPKVVAFNINNFILMQPNGEIFDESDLCLKNLQTTNYDYRNCRFALLPQRDWFK